MVSVALSGAGYYYNQSYLAGMLDIRIVIGIFAILHIANGASTECTEQYRINTTAAGDNDTLLCHAVKDYVTCLEGKLNDASCTLNDTERQEIQVFDLPGKCALNGTTCECEVNYAKANISPNTNKCMETKKYVACLKGKTGTGCVATDTVIILATAAGAALSDIGETNCPLSNTTCECEVTFAKADISSDANMCTALKNEISCLVGKTDNACDGSTNVSSISATVANDITGTSGCHVDENCQCEIDYVKTVTPANKCTKTKTLAACIQYEYDNGCGSERTRDKIGSYIQTTITEDSCPATDTCQCQIDFAKASVTTANKCSSAKAFSTCIENVDDATDFGCDGVTQGFIKTNSSGIQKEFCSASGMPVASLLLVLPVAVFYL